jgi:microsomal epoxide hydrolase
MIYWVTQSMPSSTRIYFESQHSQPRPKSMSEFSSGGPPAPVGYALFPKAINVPPRAWVERSTPTLIHWTEMPRGGTSLRWSSRNCWPRTFARFSRRC